MNDESEKSAGVLRRQAFELGTNPIAVRIPAACGLIGVGRTKLYELIADGHIETIKLGAITLIPYDSLQAFIETRRAR